MYSESQRLSYLVLRINIFLVCSGQVFWSYNYLFMNLRGLGLLSLGTIGSITSLTVIAGLAFSSLADKFAQHKTFFIASCLIMSLIQGVYSLASGFAPFLLLNLGISLANVIMMGPIYAVIMLTVVGGIRPGRQLGGYRIWGSLSWIVLQPAAGLIAERYSLNVLFPIGAVFYLLSAVSAFFLPQPVKRTAHASPDRRPVTEYLLQRKVLSLLVAQALLGMVSVGNFLNIYLKQIGASLATIGLMQGLWVIPEVPSLLLITPLCDRIGRKPVILLHFLVAPLQLLWYGATQSVLAILGVQIVFKLLSFGSGYAVQLYISEIVPRQSQARVLAVLSTTSGLMGVVGSYIAGYLGQTLGLSSMYLIQGAIATIPITFLALTRKSW